MPESCINIHFHGFENKLKRFWLATVDPFDWKSDKVDQHKNIMFNQFTGDPVELNVLDLLKKSSTGRFNRCTF